MDGSFEGKQIKKANKKERKKCHEDSMQPEKQVVCSGENLVYNGGFEHGFNPASIGHVGRGWGSFTNGGAAEYGFYDEMWEPVVSSCEHGQLIEINTKGFNPADGNRYAIRGEQ